MGIFSFSNKNTSLNKNTPEVFELKKNESKTINGLTITNNGGGHEILKDGDLPFTEIELKKSNKTEKIIVYGFEQKIWNGYELIFKDMGRDGEFVRFSMKKVGE